MALLPARVAQRAGLSGVVIERVEAGSAAASAGLRGLSLEGGRMRLGDIIVAVDDKPVTSPDDLFHVLESRSAGEEVRLKIRRDGATQTLTLTLQAG